MTRDSDFAAQLASLVGVAVPVADSVELCQQILKTGEHSRRRLVTLCHESSGDSGVLGNEHSRITLARLIVALMPHTNDLIREILTSEDSLQVELHFSLFVALSDIASELDEGQRKFLLGQLAKYLCRKESDAAQEAWIAGELLGEHWPLHESLPLLMQAAREAHHPAGREAAIHGLSHGIARAEKRQQWAILQTLTEISEHDRSQRVAEYARLVAGPLRGI